MLTRIRRLIVHRQPAVNNLTRGPWLKRSSGGADAPGIWVGIYSYTTPATGAAPISGEIVHANNIVNKFAISHFDMNGRNLASAIAQMTTGDFIKVGGTTFNIIAPVVQDISGNYSYITISPTTQLPDAIYPVILRKEGVEEPTEPINTVAPVIAGTLNVGMVLSCSTGTWTGLQPITYTYQWQSGGVNVSGATSNAYVLQSSDVGKNMTCVVTATNKLGTDNATSNSLGPVLIAAPVNTVAPTVTGDATEGNLLTSTNGSWSSAGALTYAYQWLRNGVAISGATANTYTSVTADVGKTVSCRVTATNAGGSSSAQSNGMMITEEVILPPVNTVAPAVTGNAHVGSLLTSTTGTWTGDPPITYVYQWKADTVNIAGANTATYTTVSGDIGKTITCRITATNPGGATIATSNGIVVTDVVFSPADLFSAGEEGAWYDPSDFSTMFQDSTGTTPVTAVGQTVGLILDKSKGLVLGAEVITNPADREFSSDTGFWTKGTGVTISGGVVNVNGPGGDYPIYRFNAIHAGYFEATYTLTVESGSIELFLNAPASVARTASGTYTDRFYNSSLGTLGFRTLSAFVGTIDNFSVRYVTGNHATQATAASRPALANNSNTKPYRNFDAVDDSMGTMFASSLGSSCTVARADPSTGAVILTSQTIGTSYSASADDCALIIVDRALTTQETTDLTAWLNGKAGV